MCLLGQTPGHDGSGATYSPGKQFALILLFFRVSPTVTATTTYRQPPLHFVRHYDHCSCVGGAFIAQRTGLGTSERDPGVRVGRCGGIKGDGL